MFRFLMFRSFVFTVAILILASAGLQAQAGEIPRDLGLKVNPLLEAHNAWFEPETVYDFQDPKTYGGYLTRWRPKGLDYKIYSAVGYGLANTVMLVGSGGRAVIIDTQEDPDTAEAVVEAFRGVLGLDKGDPLPIDAIIYTHNHIDHTGGVAGFLSSADRRPCDPENPDHAGRDDLKPYRVTDQCLAVFGQVGIVDGVINTSTVVNPILNTRSAYSFGNLIQGVKNGQINDGIGPVVNSKTLATFRRPSKTFTNELRVEAAGMSMVLIYAPSETNDELVVFVPDALNGARGDAGADWLQGPGLLQVAEMLQGPAFPNLHSLRGSKFRNPKNWYETVDRVRQLDTWCMVPSHEPPLCGQENVSTLMLLFRDAVQFTHNQTLRYMNLGYTPDEMVALVKLPQYILDGLESIETVVPEAMDPRDYLRPYYGSVPQAVREIYAGYLGWFEADPVGLDPTPPVEMAQRYITMMGGADQVREAAAEAILRRNYQWAAELATLLIRVNHDDKKARQLKAEAFLRLADPQINTNWRNWYVTSAVELLDYPQRQANGALVGGLVSPLIVGSLDAGAWIEAWGWRLDPVKSLGHEQTLGVWIPPNIQKTGARGYALQVRNAVAQYTDLGSEMPTGDVVLSIPKVVLDALLIKAAEETARGTPPSFGDLIAEAVEEGKAKLLAGDVAGIKAFFTFFDDPSVELPLLTVR